MNTGRRRSGFTRERAGPAGQSPPAVHRCRATVFAGKPAPTHASVVDTGRRRSGFTREAGDALHGTGCAGVRG
ncbi:hypothetical protein C4Q27_20110 [Pseudomonas sp. SWI36]|nr:hypothetical protein C4Q27_20110 [Pseudomonas sp. SWI36]